MFLRGEICPRLVSLSLLELRDNHENGLVNFREGGGGGPWAVGTGGGGAIAFDGGFGLLDGDSDEGDQGMAGKAFVILLSDSVLLG